MKRRYFYLLTIIFLLGCLALDFYTAKNARKLQNLVRSELGKVLKAPAFAQVRMVGPTQFELFDIEIMRETGSNDEILVCPSAVITLDWFKALWGDVRVKTVVFQDPEVHLYWERGELSLPRVFSTPDNEDDSGLGILPQIAVKGLSVFFHDAPFWAGPEVAISNIDIGITPNIMKNYPYHLQGSIDDRVFGAFELAADFGKAPLKGEVVHRSFRLKKEALDHLNESLSKPLNNIALSGGNIGVKVEFWADDALDRVESRLTATFDQVAVGYREWPLGITDLNGVVTLQDLQLEADGLEFKLSGAQVTVDSAIVDLVPSEPEFRIVGDMRELFVNNKFIRDLEGLQVNPFIDVAESLEALGAHGKVDVDFNLSQDAEDNFDGVKVDIVAQFRGADLMFRGYYDKKTGEREGYPYPLKKVVGTVHIGNNRLDFRDLSSTVRSPDLVANGSVTYGEADFSYDIDIRGYDVHLDEKVRQTLPPDVREVYDSYAPSGPVNFTLQIKRPPKAESPDLHLDVELKGCAALPQLFPYRLEDLRGHLIFGKEGGTLISGITAAHGGASFDIEGLLDHQGDEDGPAYNLTIGVDDLQVNEELMTGISREFPDIASELRRYGFTGKIDFDCSINSKEEGALNVFQAELKGLRFCYEKFPNAICTDLFGQVFVQGDRLDFNRTTFQLCGSEMAASGWVNLGETAGHDIEITSKDFAITPKAIEIATDAAPSIRELDDILDITGNISLGLRIRSSPQGNIFRTNLTAQGLTIALPEYNLEAKSVYGSLEIDGDDLNFKGWTGVIPYGSSDPKSLALQFSVNSGHFNTRSDGARLNLHHIGFDNLLLDERLRDRLPDDIAEQLKDFKLAGHLKGKIDSFFYAQDNVIFSGEVTATNVRADPGVPFAINHGTIVIEDAQVSTESFNLEGTLEDADLEIQGFPVTSSSAIFQLNQRSFAFREFAGDCLGGKINPVQSYFTYVHGGDETFDTSISLKNLDLSKLARSMGANADSVVGKGDGWARLSGILTDHASFEGAGEVWVSGEKLYELPILANILQFVNFDFLIRAGGQEQRAHFNVTIEDESIAIENARFEGPGIALDGGGHIGFNGVAQLEFTPTIIKLLDGIPVLGDIVNVVTGFLVSKIKISGPLEDLRAEGDNYLTELLPGEKDTGRRLKTMPLKVDTRN